MKKESTSKYPNLYDQVLHSDWVISVDTLFKGEVHLPQNLKITDLNGSYSRLELGEHALIDMDFQNHKIEVKSGNSLYISKGGKID